MFYSISEWMHQLPWWLLCLFALIGMITLVVTLGLFVVVGVFVRDDKDETII